MFSVDDVFYVDADWRLGERGARLSQLSGFFY